MPLHVFIAQSASLLTGGLDIWKAAKDVIVIVLSPLMIYLAYKQKLFDGKYKWHLLIGAAYITLHLLFVVFDQNDDTYSAILASVYNSRLLFYLLLGMVVGSAVEGKKYLKYLLTFAVLIATAVALFGIFQYFLPPDLLTHVGYSLERGVKPLFFIDDRVDLPRIMSTLKDPNSLGAYLIMPILLAGYALFNNKANKILFIRPMRRGVLIAMLGIMLFALFLTFSRGALLGLALSVVALLSIVTGDRVVALARKYWYIILILLSIITISTIALKDSALIQDYVFHAAVSTNQEDPNEKRVTLVQGAIEDIEETPLGSGPGSAGLVSITNPQGGVLTENYYLQIAYEVGWLGIVLFLTIIVLLFLQLQKICNYKSDLSVPASIVLASLVAYLFYSLLIHLWSNEAVALQWWLLCGVVLGLSLSKTQRKSQTS